MMPVLAVLQAVPLLPPLAQQVVIYRAGGEEVAMLAIVFGTLSGLFYPLVRALARRLDSRGAPAALPTHEVEERLERIERAVEAVAVEVERISEGQRFVTKLMSERPPASLPAPDQ